MATEKKITSRIQQKHDVAANWAKATNFIPKKGEIIIYDAEYNASGEETQAVRFKIGDGSKTVNNLPFAVIDGEQKISGIFNFNTGANYSKSMLSGGRMFFSSTEDDPAFLLVGKEDVDNIPIAFSVVSYSNSSFTSAVSVGDGQTTEVLLGGETGSAKQVFTSQGSGATPKWTSVVNSLNGNTGDITGIATTSQLDNKQDKITSSNKLSSSLVSDLGAAAAKAVDTAITANSTSTNLPTSKAVEDRINAHSGIDKVGTVTGVKMNGTTKNPSSGVVDLGTVLTKHQSIKSINTNNTAAQAVNANEAIADSGTINLHKIAKTGNYNDLLNKPSFADIPDRGEAFLTWGGKNFAASYSPIDAAMVPALGANRLAFVSAAGIKVEYSRDNGTTWSDYELNDSQKTAIFSGPQVSTTAVIGKPGSKNPSTNKYDNASVNNRLRITILTNFASVYTQLNKFVIYCSTSGSDGCKCTIDGRTKANYDANSSTWTTFADGVAISGWSGFNVINTPSITTYGNTSNQYVELRFTFYCTSAGSMATYGGLQISNIYGFGGVGWTTPSTMAKWGQVYTYDASQNVTFPAAVKANTLYENGTTLSSKYQAKGNYVNKTEVVQATGTSTTSIMSQKATTDELAKKANLQAGTQSDPQQFYGVQQFNVDTDEPLLLFCLDRGDYIANINSTDCFNYDPNGVGDMPIKMAGNAGTSGQVLTSRGAGATPQWSTPPKFSFSNGVLTITT